MEAIKGTVSEIMSALVEKKRVDKGNKPQALLKRVFSKKEIGHIRFKYVRKGVLGLDVNSSAWLYYFSLRKEGLVSKAQSIDPQIKDIRFRVGEVDAKEKNNNH